jgi:hypothetical protein
MTAASRQTRYLERQKAGMRVYDLEADEVGAEEMCASLGYVSADVHLNVSQAWALFVELHQLVTRRGKSFADVLISVADAHATED